MKRISLIILVFITTFEARAQDMSINVLQSPANMPTGSEGKIQVDVCNNDPSPDRVLGAYKIIATIEVNPYVEITGTSSLPAGWSVCSGTEQMISVSNGSDAGLTPGGCRTFFVDVQAGATAQPATEVTGTLTFAGGTDQTKCEVVTGAGDDIAGNNSSKSSVKVSDVPLPVTLIAFTAKREENSVVLQWETSTETNSDFFEILQSVDAVQWKAVGRVSAEGESNRERTYRFVHEGPDQLQNYYKLKMVDRDGTYAYSTVRSLLFEGYSETAVYPVPASQSLTVRPAAGTTLEKIELVDLRGVTVFDSGNRVVSQIDTKSITSGIYMLRLTRKGGSVELIKTMIFH